MKIEELIKELQEYDKNQEIKISQDEEGNLFKEIEGVYETDEGIVIYPYS
ncbi:hypothetical protein ACFL54_09670 [Planctomycetota bacterium]